MRLVLLLALACTEPATQAHPLAAPATGEQGAPGPQGPAGDPGPGYMVEDADGSPIAPLAGVRLEGSEPVLIWWWQGLIVEAWLSGEVRHTTGVFSEADDCSPPYLIPSASGRSDADAVLYEVSNWYGATHAAVKRSGQEREFAMMSYGYATATERSCLIVNQGSQPGVEVTLEPAPAWRGPLRVRER